MRFTKKQRFTPFNDYELNFELDNGKLNPTGNQQDILNKLGQLEDIEYELGIELITFFKYLNAKQVFYKELRKIKIAKVWSIDKQGIIVVEKGFEYSDCEFHLYFKDYGKTWALTKEELL